MPELLGPGDGDASSSSSTNGTSSPTVATAARSSARGTTASPHNKHRRRNPIATRGQLGHPTRYMNAALEQFRAHGHPVQDKDVARLSAFRRRHLRVHGDYSFLLPELAGALRMLRDPDNPDYEQDEDEE